MSIIIKDAESSLLMCRETIVLQSVEKNNLECIAGWLVPKAACMPDCAGLTLSGICYFFLPLLRLLWPFADMTIVYMGKKINSWGNGLYRMGTRNYPVIYQCCSSCSQKKCECL